MKTTTLLFSALLSQLIFAQTAAVSSGGGEVVFESEDQCLSDSEREFFLLS